MSDDKEALLVEQRDRIGFITFNRPDKRNSLTPAMLDALCEVLERWTAENAVRVVIFTGAGDKAFSAGFDISAIPADEAETAENPLPRTLNRVKQFPFPTIAMINGQCYGAALNLAVCCDLRIAVETCTLAMPPAKLGIVYDPDGIAQFISAFGMSRTRELFLVGKTYTGAEALERGYVDYLATAEDLLSTTLDWTTHISRNAPLAVRGMKYILNELEETDRLSGEQYAQARDLVEKALASDDLKEAQAAFKEKRHPVFRGR